MRRTIAAVHKRNPRFHRCAPRRASPHLHALPANPAAISLLVGLLDGTVGVAPSTVVSEASSRLEPPGAPAFAPPRLPLYVFIAPACLPR